MATNKTELLANATQWLKVAKREGLSEKRIGAIFVFFDKTADGTAVCTANVDKERLKKELKVILRKLEDRVIISPDDVN